VINCRFFVQKAKKKSWNSIRDELNFLCKRLKIAKFLSWKRSKMWAARRLPPRVTLYTSDATAPNVSNPWPSCITSNGSISGWLVKLGSSQSGRLREFYGWNAEVLIQKAENRVQRVLIRDIGGLTRRQADNGWGGSGSSGGGCEGCGYTVGWIKKFKSWNCDS